MAQLGEVNLLGSRNFWRRPKDLDGVHCRRHLHGGYANMCNKHYERQRGDDLESYLMADQSKSSKRSMMLQEAKTQAPKFLSRSLVDCRGILI